MLFCVVGNVVDDDVTVNRIFLVDPVCSLRSAVCGLQSAVCSLQSAVCSLQSAVCKCHTPVIHWIRDKQEVFKNMFECLKSGGKITIQYVDHLHPFALYAFKMLNPETAEHICEFMYQCEERGTIERYCALAGFHIIESYDTESAQLVFESVESLLKCLWSITHGVFDPKLVTEERLQRYYPYSNRSGKPPFDFRGIKEESTICRLIATKQVRGNP